MEAVFLKIFNMSITAGWIALAVIVLRLLFRKAPKAISVFMWALVGIRLICPFSLESVLSLIPTSETVPSDILYSQTPTIQSGIPTLNAAVNPVITESLSPELGASVNPMQIVVFLASAVWVIGMAAMFLYTAISYLRLRFKVREAALLKDHIWICDHIDTPFIMGVIRPRIYLPSSMDEQDMEYVIAHEMAHLKRRDHLWKPLGFLLLTVYWFHPVLWLAYVLLCRDIELACDEKVIKEMGAAIKKPYSQALINCSVPRRMISACPLAFGEVGVKRRVKSVLNYKKPAFWLIVVAVIACIAASVCFLTDPKDEALPDETTDAATQNTTAGDGNNKDEAPPDETTDAAAQNTTAGDTNNVVTTEELDSLRMKYPLYFSCSTSKGLEVYIWQMAEHSYSCVLLPGSNSVYTQEDLWKFHTMATTLDEMRAIVASYQISTNDVTILPIQMPHSSYAYTIDEAYREKLTNLFWSDFPIIQASSDSSVIDTESFDLDGDGIDEQCALTYGPTSGLFTFTFSASENGRLKYFNTFSSPVLELSFEENQEGKMMLIGKDGDNVRYMGIDVYNGNIIISSDEQDITYWGEQGVNTSSQTVSKLDEAILSVLNDQYSSEKPDGLLHIESYVLLANEEVSGTAKIN